MENSEKIKISIIILSWNTKKILAQCLKSLGDSKDLQIIIVDNHSIDGSPQMIAKNFPSVKLIKNKHNLGFAKGNNQGIKKANGDFIMLLNSDTIVPKGAVQKLATFLKDNPSVGAVSPLLYFPSGKIQTDYYMRFPNIFQIFGYHNPFLRPIILKTFFKRLILSPLKKKKAFPVDQLPGAALMVKREVFEKVGLLDEKFKFLYEDVDWCWRAKKSGYQLMVLPEVKITHLGGASWKQKMNLQSLSFYKQYFASMLFFAKKNYGNLKFSFFKIALVINFIFTFKFNLAFWFAFTKGYQQQKLWP